MLTLGNRKGLKYIKFLAQETREIGGKSTQNNQKKKTHKIITIKAKINEIENKTIEKNPLNKKLNPLGKK